MFRRIFSIFCFLAVLGLIAPDVPAVNTIVGVEEADAATKKKKRKTLFDILFKPRKKKNKVRVKNVKKKNARKKTNVASGNSSAPKVVVVKNETAKKILVVGDFIGSGLAKGMTGLYADNADIVVVNKAVASSGLVRDDVVNWPERITELIEEVKPIAVVALVGMNDRQQMRLESGRVQKLSPEWRTAYENRAADFAKAGSAAGSLPFVWVGLPPVRFNKMNADYLIFNEIIRGKTELAKGAYVDVWDGFTNAEGKFVNAGPDIKGQIVRLRASKGISMTRAGRTKLAFYADKALRRLGVVGAANEFLLSAYGTSGRTAYQKPEPEYDPAGTGRTLVISLGSPASDGGETLEGESDFLKDKNGEKSVSYDLVEKGLAYQPQAGRIDAAWGVSIEPEAKKNKVVEEDKPEKTSSLEPNSRELVAAN